MLSWRNRHFFLLDLFLLPATAVLAFALRLDASGMELSSFDVDVDSGKGYELREMALRFAPSRGGAAPEETEAETSQTYRVNRESLVDLVA